MIVEIHSSFYNGGSTHRLTKCDNIKHIPGAGVEFTRDGKYNFVSYYFLVQIIEE